MTDEKARFTLRIPKTLYEVLKAEADQNKRTVSKEIEYILEKRFSESVTTATRQ